MKLYDLVKELLEESVIYRNSDKKLIWKVWRINGAVNEGSDILTFDKFMSATSPESIRRCRQKIQETFPELRASTEVDDERQLKAEEKGTFIYREPIKVKGKKGLSKCPRCGRILDFKNTLVPSDKPNTICWTKIIFCPALETCGYQISV